jgi:hypothetical protein
MCIYIFESFYIFFYIIDSYNEIDVNGANSLGENFAHLPSTLHKFNLDLR